MLEASSEFFRPHAIQAVVLGASAGATDALNRLLPRLVGNAVVIVVVHLPPRQKSLLPELFAQSCRLDVREPLDKERVGGGVIWFAPPDYHLLIERNRCFAFSLDPPLKYSRPSIDVLFESAADVYGGSLAGVVLTGANDDGASGAQAIRRAGGLVIVQDPASALAQEMPRAAIALADPQFIGSLEEIANLLSTLTKAA
jgi:two-component system, chemotaxis family, protein-glutamate methylesterase/glutaminase